MWAPGGQRAAETPGRWRLGRAERWDALHRLLSEPIEIVDGVGPSCIVDNLFLWSWPGGENDQWQNIEGLEQHKTALSQHLCDLFGGWAPSFVGIVPNFEQLYETWEILGSLVHGECNDLKDYQAAFSEKNQGRSFLFMPVGRSGWNTGARERILERIRREPAKQRLLEAGFGKGQPAILDAIVASFQRVANRIRWT